MIAKAQFSLDDGKSNYRISKELGVSEGSIRYHINKGELTRHKKTIEGSNMISTPWGRNEIDTDAASQIGLAASRVEERIAASRGELPDTRIKFTPHRNVEKGGELLLIPYLLQRGLLSFKKSLPTYQKGYYDLQFIVLLLSLLYLLRTKPPNNSNSINFTPSLPGK